MSLLSVVTSSVRPTLPVAPANAAGRSRAAAAWRGTRAILRSLPRSRRSGAVPRRARDFAELWDTLLPRLERAVTLQDHQGRTSTLAWLTLDRRGSPRPLDDLLDEAGQLLSASGGQGHREQVRALEHAIGATRRRSAEYRRRRVSAPQRARWRWTADRYDAAIATLELSVRRHEDALATVRADFAAELRSLGLAVDGGTVELLLSTVVGDDLVGIARAFDNVRALTDQLQRLVGESGEDLDSARRYYGMYSVLLRVLDRLHLGLIETVDRRYLRGLEAIVERTLTLLRETRVLARRVDHHQETLAANVQAQELTLRAASEYRVYLLEHRRHLVAARGRLAQDIAVAANTHETVAVSGELVGLMTSAQGLLDTLRQLQVPPLRAFESTAMRRELERLTLRLRGTT